MRGRARSAYWSRLLGQIEEGDDLSAGAAVLGAEQAVAHTVSDIICFGPGHSGGKIIAAGHVLEACAAGDGGGARRAVEEGHALGAGTGGVGAELARASTGGDAVLNGPGHGLGVIGVGRHVGHVDRIAVAPDRHFVLFSCKLFPYIMDRMKEKSKGCFE